MLERGRDAPPLDAGTVEEGREQMLQMSAFARKAGPLAEIGSVEEVEVDGAEGALGARLYRPEEEASATLVYFHGGGFALGNLDTHDAPCRVLCRDSGAAVLSVDYRLAPEHPYPAAAEDARAATRWALDRNDGPVAVGGDSAGANLAAVVAQQLRAELAAQLLIYPVADFSTRRPSVEENADGYLLTERDMAWFESQYRPDVNDPLASPLLADDLSGLPPAVVATAEFDPLRDEGIAYAEALEAAGVETRATCFDGLIHGFFALGPLSVAAAAAVAQIGRDLRELLS